MRQREKSRSSTLLRYWWLPLVAVAIQFSVMRLSEIGVVAEPLLKISVSFTYLLLLIVIGLNLRWLGMKLIGIGVLLNAIVILANGGLMPLNVDSLPEDTRLLLLVDVGSGNLIPGSKSILLVKDEAHLWWLGDIFTMPIGVGRDHIFFSLGDILVVFGIFSLVTTGLRHLFDALLGWHREKSFLRQRPST